MVLLSYSIRGRNVWLRFYRRGITKELEFSRGEAPKLYGLLSRAVASEGGEPGSCWSQQPVKRRLWKSLGVKVGTPSPRQEKKDEDSTPDFLWNPETDLDAVDEAPFRRRPFTSGSVYQWKDLPMDSFTSGKGRQVRPETDRDLAQLTPAANRCHIEPSGYQNRDTIGGTSRGTRFAEATAKRFVKWTQNKKARRQDYSAWKTALKGTTLRTDGGSIPLPTYSPRPTNISKLQSKVRKTQSTPTNWRYHEHSSRYH